MEEKNWNLASNSQLREEIERLKIEFEDKQNLLKEGMEKIQELNDYLVALSKQYIEVKNILNKREGKTES